MIKSLTNDYLSVQAAVYERHLRKLTEMLPKCVFFLQETVPHNAEYSVSVVKV